MFVELGVVCGGGGGVSSGVSRPGTGMLLKRAAGGADVGASPGEMYSRNAAVLGVSAESIAAGGEEEVMGEVDRDAGGDRSCRHAGRISRTLPSISTKY